MGDSPLELTSRVRRLAGRLGHVNRHRLEDVLFHPIEDRTTLRYGRSPSLCRRRFEVGWRWHFLRSRAVARLSRHLGFSLSWLAKVDFHFLEVSFLPLCFQSSSFVCVCRDFIRQVVGTIIRLLYGLIGLSPIMLVRILLPLLSVNTSNAI